MDALALWGVGFVGTVFWPLSPEAAVALYTARGHWHPLLAGPLVAGGQACAHLVLYLGGEQLRRRWRWFDAKCERARVRYGGWLHKGLVPLGCASGLIGLPPSSVTAALAPGLGLSGRRLLPLLFGMRVLRLTAVAYLARALGGALPRLW
jgi:hypothetical protein